MSDCADVLISYSSADLTAAETIYHRLAGLGFDVWFDKARIQPGSYWDDALYVATGGVRVVVAVLTPEWKQSRWTQFETYRADHIVPVLCRGEWHEVATPQLRHIQYLDLRNPLDPQWSALATTVRNCLNRATSVTPAQLLRLPFPANPHFTGRSDLLLDVLNTLWAEPAPELTRSHPCALAGLGGVGKTTIARQFLENFWRGYKDVIWINAEPHTLLAEFAHVALELKLIQHASGNPADDARIALHELNQPVRRVLVLDNAEDEASIAQWLPCAGGCHTLITSRFSAWSANIHSFEVGTLPLEEAARFLLRRTGNAAAADSDPIAGQLAATLGSLPLALEQAAAFIKRTGVSLAQYADLYKQARAQLLALHTPGATRYAASVATTWFTTFRLLSEPGRFLLCFSAFLAPSPVPVALLADSWEIYRHPVNGDKLAHILEVIAELHDYSMINVSTGSYVMHSLLQEVVRDAQSSEDRSSYATSVICALAVVFPTPAVANWPYCAALLPHALFAIPLLHDEAIGADLAAPFLDRVASYLLSLDIEHSLRRSLETEALRRCESGNVEPALHVCVLSNLGSICESDMDHLEAERCVKAAIDILRRSGEEASPVMSKSLDGLVVMYRASGRLAEAAEACRESMEITARCYGETHAQYAVCLNNLAAVYESAGDPASARPLAEQAVKLRRSLGLDAKPDLPISLNVLGGIYTALELHVEAVKCHREALELRRALYGEKSLHYAHGLKSLAQALPAVGGEAEAEMLLRDAISIIQRAVGDRDFRFMECLALYASLHKVNGNLVEAEAAYRRVLASLASQPDQPIIGPSLAGLAEVCRRRRKYGEAQLLYDQALALYERNGERACCADVFDELATLRLLQLQLQDVQHLCARALEISQDSLGSEHPKTVRRRARLRQYRRLRRLSVLMGGFWAMVISSVALWLSVGWGVAMIAIYVALIVVSLWMRPVDLGYHIATQLVGLGTALAWRWWLSANFPNDRTLAAYVTPHFNPLCQVLTFLAALASLSFAVYSDRKSGSQPVRTKNAR
jgi:tetratricopeptide (TPR) repeat protein